MRNSNIGGKRVNWQKLFLMILFWSCFLTCPLLAADLACPVTLPVQQTVSSVPAGWEAISSLEPVHLDRVAFYLKHPKEGGSLVPDKTEKQKGEERETWTFVRGPADEFWLGCMYAGTTVILVQKLKADV